MRVGSRLAALALAALAAACSQESDRVVLITIDALRADRVGAYGYADAHTPVLDQLAIDGARFETAISPVPLTRPAHATLLTGLDPHEHGVRHDVVYKLGRDATPLAERFQQRRIATAAFVAASVLGRDSGLARGFDEFDEGMPAGTGQRRSDAVVTAAIDWLDTAPDRFFLWVHLADPELRFEPRASRIWGGEQSAYDARVSFADAQLGRLLRALDARWPIRGTAVLVTSGHGEELGDHGQDGHAYALYDSTQRVPLLLRAAGVPAESRVSAAVRLIDVAPTLAALAGLEPLQDASGVNLLDQFVPDAEAPPPAYLESLAPALDFGWSPLYGLRDGRWKYIRAPKPELYDLVRDPGELDNRIDEETQRATQMERALDQRMRSIRLARPLEPRDRKHLASLGFDVDERLVPEVGGVDPKDRTKVIRACEGAEERLTAGRPKEALALLKGINEPSARVVVLRARAFLAAGNHASAAREAERASKLAPEMYMPQYLLGFAQLHTGKRDAAIAALQRAVRLGPDSPLASFTLGQLAESEGRASEAERHYRDAVITSSGSVEARVRLAALYLEQRRTVEADQELARAGSLRDLRPDHLLRLALAELRSGQSERGFERVREAARWYPRSHSVQRTLAMLYDDLGQREAALEIWRTALSLAPDDKLARERIAALTAEEKAPTEPPAARSRAPRASRPERTSP
jgi:choline-sulfatase